MNFEDEVKFIKFDMEKLQKQMDLLFRRLEKLDLDSKWIKKIHNSVVFTLPTAIQTLAKDVNKLKKKEKRRFQ